MDRARSSDHLWDRAGQGPESRSAVVQTDSSGNGRKHALSPGRERYLYEMGPSTRRVVGESPSPPPVMRRCQRKEPCSQADLLGHAVSSPPPPPLLRQRSLSPEAVVKLPRSSAVSSTGLGDTIGDVLLAAERRGEVWHAQEEVRGGRLATALHRRPRPGVGCQEAAAGVVRPLSRPATDHVPLGESSRSPERRRDFECPVRAAEQTVLGLQKRERSSGLHPNSPRLTPAGPRSKAQVSCRHGSRAARGSAEGVCRRP